MLRTADRTHPNIEVREANGRLVFVPYGGSDPSSWATRFAPLGVPELHLYDREFWPDTQARYDAARIVNARPCCRAYVTRRPSLECYLHPEAIWQATGIRVAFDPGADVVEAIARARFARLHSSAEWQTLPARSRKRLRNRIKRRLNNAAVRYMTPELLAERDPYGEIVGWFSAAAELLGSR